MKRLFIILFHICIWIGAVSMLIIAEDTVFDIDASQAQRIIQLHKAANIGEFTVFMPDSLVNIHFTNRGFGKYWYEIPHHPYSE